MKAVTDPNSKTVIYYYSNADKVTQVTDANGNSTLYNYANYIYGTAYGSLTKLIKPDGKATTLHTTSMAGLRGGGSLSRTILMSITSIPTSSGLPLTGQTGSQGSQNTTRKATTTAASERGTSR
jgi:YD repeat-containing protein